MTLDQFSVSVMTAAVVVIVGVIYISETLLRRDEVSSRYWSIAFLSGIGTTVAYVLWAAGAGWLAIAVGNALFVAATGFIWLGSRGFNRADMRWPYATVGAGMAIAFVSVAVAGPGGGDWAGAAWMYLVLTVLAALGCIETLRGRMSHTRTTVALALVLAVEAVYTAGRAVALVTVGYDSEFFQVWFGSVPASFVTIALVITAAIVTSVLRAGRTGVRAYTNMVTGESAGRILSGWQFRATVGDVLERAAEKPIGVGVIAIRIDDLPHIATAFGGDVAREVAVAAREAVRATSEPLAVIGDDGATVLRVCTTATDRAELRQQASRLAASVFDALRCLPDAVVPVVGIGVAGTDAFGYRADALIAAADAASARSARSGDISVLVADTMTSTSTSGIPTVPKG